MKKEQGVTFIGVKWSLVKNQSPLFQPTPGQGGTTERPAETSPYHRASSSTSLLSGIFRGECAGETVYSDFRGEYAGDAVCSDFLGEAVIGPG